MVARDPRTLERWVTYGWLRPANFDEVGRPLYSVSDLAEAHYEATSRRRQMQRRLVHRLARRHARQRSVTGSLTSVALSSGQSRISAPRPGNPPAGASS